MRTISGFRAVRAVTPTPDGCLYVVGRHDKIGGTALYEVWPDGKVTRCGPASPHYSDWIDVIDFDFPVDPHGRGVTIRYRGFGTAFPITMPHLFSRPAGLTWAHDLRTSDRLWAGGQIYVNRPVFDSVEVSCPPIKGTSDFWENKLGGPAEHFVHPDGVTVLIRKVTALEDARHLRGGHVTSGVRSVDWEVRQFFRDGRARPEPQTHDFERDAYVSLCSGGLLVQEGRSFGSRGAVSDAPVCRTLLIGPDGTVTNVPHANQSDFVLDAVPNGPVLAMRDRDYRRQRLRQRDLLVDGLVYRFFGRRSVVGARLAPDGCTAYAWTRTELIQFDL